MIFARSFARIHETNLKKQGILPLTFADPATYDAIGERDRISVLDLAALAPDRPVPCRIDQAGRFDRRLHVRRTRSTWSRSSGSTRAARSNVIRRRQSRRRSRRLR